MDNQMNLFVRYRRRNELINNQAKDCDKLLEITVIFFKTKRFIFNRRIFTSLTVFYWLNAELCCTARMGGRAVSHTNGRRPLAAPFDVGHRLHGWLSPPLPPKERLVQGGRPAIDIVITVT